MTAAGTRPSRDNAWSDGLSMDSEDRPEPLGAKQPTLVPNAPMQRIACATERAMARRPLWRYRRKFVQPNEKRPADDEMPVRRRFVGTAQNRRIASSSRSSSATKPDEPL